MTVEGVTFPVDEMGYEPNKHIEVDGFYIDWRGVWVVTSMLHGYIIAQVDDITAAIKAAKKSAKLNNEFDDIDLNALEIKNAKDFTAAEVAVILNKGFDRAREASVDEAAEWAAMGNDGFGNCGTSWVSIRGIRANSKLGNILKAAAGVRHCNYSRSFDISSTWNNSQNVAITEAGCVAMVSVLKEFGFNASSTARLN